MQKKNNQKRDKKHVLTIITFTLIFAANINALLVMIN